MSIRILWRSTVFIITLILIYFAFPILIIPSSLPAIQQLFVENQYPQDFLAQQQTPSSTAKADLEIYQLTISTVPTWPEKIDFLKQLHRQGLNKIFHY